MIANSQEKLADSPQLIKVLALTSLASFYYLIHQFIITVLRLTSLLPGRCVISDLRCLVYKCAGLIKLKS